VNLYQIDEQILKLIDPETGEIGNEEAFNALEMERDLRIENTALWVKNLKAEAEALKAEKLKLAERQKAAENKIKSLTAYLEHYLNGDKFKTAKVAISYRKSKAVAIIEPTEIPAEYWKVREPEFDKTALKKALEEGNVPGAELVENVNMTIK
jgi:t-SNARE complex subunit (syntaxin)